MSSLENLPKSALLLVGFAQYCEIKRGCPHFSSDEHGASKCHYPDFGGTCRFEECPVMKTGGRE
jgi:hypothetical protein